MSRSIIEDLRENGLPPWVYTWKFVVFLGLGGPFVVMILGSLVSMLTGLLVGPSTHAPSCFTVSFSGPISAGTRSLDRSSDDVEALHQGHTMAIAAVAKASEACTAASCPSAARERWRREVIVYSRRRGQAMQTMYGRYGERGLALVERVYGTLADVDIVNGMRERFNAGYFDVRRLHGAEDVVRMLLFKPLSELSLCRM